MSSANRGFSIHGKIVFRVVCGLALLMGQMLAETFSIAVLGDMHLMTSSHRNRALAQTRWIASNTNAPWNIKLTVQLGDLVQVGADNGQWGLAMEALNGLVPAQNAMAVSITPGNHDYNSYQSGNWSRANATYYTQKVGKVRWQNYSWFGGSSPNDRSHFQLYNAGGYTFMHIDIEWNSSAGELAWVNQVLASHPNLPTTISTHEYTLESSGRTGVGNRFWDHVVKNNKQIFLVMSGHICSSSGTPGDGEGNRIVRNSAGLEVMEALTDYQNYQAANGWTRLYTIDTAGTSNNIRAKTYSPIRNAYGTHAKGQFSWTVNFQQRYGNPDGGTGTDTVKPSAPANLAASSVTSNSVALSWTSSSDNVGVVGYDVYSGATKVGSSTVNSFQLSGLTAATAYSFKVVAKDAAGNKSNDSNVLAVTTQSAADIALPSVPANLVARAQSSSAIGLTWSASTDNVGVTGYEVYQGSTKIATVMTTNYSVSGLTANTTFYFKVQARDAAGNLSGFGNVANATTSVAGDSVKPSVPANLAAMALSNSSILTTWSASTDNVGVSGYDVYRNGSKVATATTNSFLHTGLAANSPYSFKVHARDAAGNVSDASSTVNATTLTNPITPEAFVMGVNLGNSSQSTALTIEGRTWKTHTAAMNSGMSLAASSLMARTAINPAASQIGSPALPLTPAIKDMLNSALWSTGTVGVNQNLPNGTYTFYLWVMENYRSNHRSFNVKAEGQTMATNIGKMNLGTWRKYGPYTVGVRDGQLNIQLIPTFGHAHVMGITIHTAPAVPNPLP